GLKVSVRIAGRVVVARLWKAQVGRGPVYLLDTNCNENVPSDRDITHRLYGGDESTRVRQEMILGIGGLRTLRALGVQPAVWHLNEGHAAFLILELLREHLSQGLPFNAALEAVAADCVFTTHTPVAAGHDAFGHELIVAHFGDFVRELGVPVERVLDLARAPSSPGLFNMTRLALSGTRHVNGVSRIHGAVSARLVADQWPEVRPEDNPIGFVTNGVHVPTFLHQSWMDFFDRELGSEWRERLRDPEFWSALERVPDERYWATAQEVKARMLASVRERLQREYERKGLSPAQLRHVTRLLDPLRPGVLTLGFARRRVAQQPDCAARGERHLRHQGGHQRAPQPEHPRRLVGGGLEAGQRLGHTAGQRSGSRAARCARGRADPRHARGGGGAALL